MPGGVRFHSLVDHTGYGQAGIGYVRALVNAGVPVEWVAVRYAGDGAAPVPRDAIALAREAAGDGAIGDLPALLAATAAPLDTAVNAMWCVPEAWHSLWAEGARNVGMTVWETDRIPAHWKRLLDAPDALVVPCTMNRDVFAAAGVRPPVHVVPHVRRHAWNAFTPDELAAARAGFGLDADSFVFYAISTWDPRKDVPVLLDAFAHAFTAADPVALVVKLAPLGYGDPPYCAQQPTTQLAEHALARIGAALGRPLPRIVLLPYDINTRGIDLLHALGDAYVNLAHGEGFALGAFDAATRGTPVVMPDWGGPRDYLGTNPCGAVPVRMTSACVFPPSGPSYWPSQRWASVARDDAVAALQRVWREHAAACNEAVRIEADIAVRFAEPPVARALVAALFA